MYYKNKEIDSKHELPKKELKKLNVLMGMLRQNMHISFNDYGEKCALCNKQAVLLHHENYDVPECFYFLCKSCHHKIHMHEVKKRELEYIYKYLKNNKNFVNKLIQLKTETIKHRAIRQYHYFYYKKINEKKFEVKSDRTSVTYYIDI